jgi:hypothetical protein
VALRPKHPRHRTQPRECPGESQPLWATLNDFDREIFENHATTNFPVLTSTPPRYGALCIFAKTYFSLTTCRGGIDWGKRNKTKWLGAFATYLPLPLHLMIARARRAFVDRVAVSAFSSLPRRMIRCSTGWFYPGRVSQVRRSSFGIPAQRSRDKMSFSTQ